jgi:hypothetical protein
MLAVPARTQIGDLTAYADDTDYWRYYLVPATPRVRRDAAGEPALLLLSYALSDEERAAHPELEGGGYLTLDTVLDPTAAEVAAAVAVLQPLVDAEARQRGQSPAPEVEIGSPTWTAGAVTLDAPQSTALVSARIAAGAPSLLAGNAASFSLDLTTSGAQLLADALTGDPAGAAPLQVNYDLSFWARLPPARIHLGIDAEKMHDYLRKQIQSRALDPSNCTRYTYDTSDVTEESLTLSGAVTVQIDTGSGSLPDDVVAELRAYAFDTLKQVVQSTFFQPAPDTAPPPRPGQPPVPRPWHDPVLEVKDLDRQTMSVSLDLEQSSVVAWPVHPRGTLTGLLGPDPAVRERHVRQVRLDDPFFADLNVDVDVFADFGEIALVEVQLEFTGSAADGGVRHEATTLTFAAGAAGTQHWAVPLFGDEPVYRSRHRVVLPGGTAGPYSDWADSRSRRLVLSLPTPGILRADVLAGSVDFDSLVASVQVTFAYEDQAHGVPRDERTVVLTRDTRAAHYEHRIGVPQQERLLHKVRFDLLTGDVIADDEWRPVPGGQVVVNQPSESVLKVSLLPTGSGWHDVVAVLVDLRHVQPDGRVVADTLTLHGLDEFATWQVYLPDRTARAYRYRWTASFADGDLVATDWADNPDGDPVLPVTLRRPGTDVTVVADALDFAASPLTEVTLVCGDETTTLLFRDRTPQLWHVRAAPAGIELTWTATHFPADGDPVELPPRVEHDPVVVLLPFRAPVPVPNPA